MGKGIRLTQVNSGSSMNGFSNWKEGKGFTIQELMVVLVVGSLLVTFSFSIFLFVNKLFVSWQKKTVLRAAVSHLLNTISLDLLESKQAEEMPDTALAVIKLSDIYVRYRFDGRRVWRNNDLIASGDATAFSLKVDEGSAPADGAQFHLLKIKILGISNTLTYSLETEVTMAWSSRGAFLHAMAPTH